MNATPIFSQSTKKEPCEHSKNFYIFCKELLIHMELPSSWKKSQQYSDRISITTALIRDITDWWATDSFGEIPREQKEAILPAEAGSSSKTLQEFKSCRIFLCIGAWVAGVGNPNSVSIIHFTTGDEENLTMLLKIHRPKVVKKRVSSPLAYSSCLMTLREDWTNYNPYSPFSILSSSSVLGSGFVCPNWILRLKCIVRMIGFASHHLPPQFGFLHQLQDHH